MAETVEFYPYTSFPKVHYETKHIAMEQNGHEEKDIVKEASWFEEEIDVDLKWSFALNRYLCITSFTLSSQS